MFEGKIQTAHAGELLDANGGHADLRAISWPELVTQIQAARQIRSAPCAGEAGAEASFAPDPARRIAAICDGKPNVNLDDLANGKLPMAISRSANNGAARDDRERT